MEIKKTNIEQFAEKLLKKVIDKKCTYLVNTCKRVVCQEMLKKFNIKESHLYNIDVSAKIAKMLLESYPFNQIEVKQYFYSSYNADTSWILVLFPKYKEFLANKFGTKLSDDITTDLVISIDLVDKEITFTGDAHKYHTPKSVTYNNYNIESINF